MERRRNARVTAPAHGINQARIRPGVIVVVVNVSADGACLETRRRLLPGTQIDLYLERSGSPLALRASVGRCAVVRLAPSHVFYRAAVQFADRLLWFAAVAAEYEVQDSSGPAFSTDWVSASRHLPHLSRVHDDATDDS